MIGKGNDCLFSHYVKVPLFEGSTDFKYLRVRCGTCYNCKRFKADEWCMRNEMEARYWTDVAFTTLTYETSQVPKNFVDTELFVDTPEIWKPITFDEKLAMQEVLTLDREEVKKFFKRLRKHLDYKIRYYCVGEYGTQKKRPHLHAIIFGLKPEDWHYVNDSWQHGFTYTKALQSGTSAYVSGYVQKKLYGNLQNPFKIPEFLNASQHLGERWLMEHLGDFDDEHPYIVFNGYKHPIPRTFARKLVDMGIFQKMSVLEICSLQKKQYLDLMDHCLAQGITESQYFHNRIIEAQAKARKSMASRDKNKEL